MSFLISNHFNILLLLLTSTSIINFPTITLAESPPPLPMTEPPTSYASKRYMFENSGNVYG